jgi:hypothetical protein
VLVILALTFASSAIYFTKVAILSNDLASTVEPDYV